MTLIEDEATDAMRRVSGIDPGGSRRNVTTRGVALSHLVGRHFTMGLTHRGGLRVEILSEGVIRVGDEIEEEA